MPINKLNHGPAARISITLEMLQLLSRASNNTKEELNEEEAAELKCFAEMVKDLVEDPGSPDTLHGFCL